MNIKKSESKISKTNDSIYIIRILQSYLKHLNKLSIDKRDTVTMDITHELIIFGKGELEQLINDLKIAIDFFEDKKVKKKSRGK